MLADYKGLMVSVTYNYEQALGKLYQLKKKLVSARIVGGDRKKDYDDAKWILDNHGEQLLLDERMELEKIFKNA